ncbi:MAG: FliM/FliN family flagellar motor switch protein [Pseudomonadota bacterium]
MNSFNSTLQRFGEVTVRLSVELGRTEMPLREVLALAEGSVVALDRMTDELLDVTANGRAIARGEVVAQDGKFALRIVSLVQDAATSGAPANAFSAGGQAPPSSPEATPNTAPAEAAVSAEVSPQESASPEPASISEEPSPEDSTSAAPAP